MTKPHTQPDECRSGGYRDLQAIVLDQKPYGWYASLQWDNSFVNPDFATCRANEDQALADMRAAIQADGRLKGYDIDSLPVIRKPMKPEIKEVKGDIKDAESLTVVCKKILEDLRRAMHDNDTDSIKGILLGDVVSELLKASDDVPVAADWLTQASMCLKCGQAEEKGCPYCPVATEFK